VPQIEIIPVDDSRKLRAFIRLPWKIYQGDSYWVPPLIMDIKKLLDKKKHPFYLHSEAELFLARRNGENVGRIAAILNNNHNAFHNEKLAFFGFFEAINDTEVAAALFETAENWARAKGMTTLRGPANYSTNETCGLLVEGFDDRPRVMMTYNPKYYVDLIEGRGFTKAMDLYAWWMEKETGLNPKVVRVGEKLVQDERLVLRNLDLKNFPSEIQVIKKIYNEAWSDNWGFVPMTDAEFEHLAKDLKPVVDPRLVMIAEKNGEPVGFSLALPDLNEALHKINGRLLPFGIFKVLHHSRRIHTIRVLTLGLIRRLHANSGLGAVLYMEMFRRFVAAGFDKGEFSWTLEINDLMNRGIKLLGAKIYKRYRMYDKPL
jgi:GNAT superfamily N-acetyltransferase